ncbi:MAG: twin-arginine translocase TatA/TatE family subunit [Myxococcota bacterium]
MFGLGIGEIAVIVAVALVVLGPRKLPQVAKQLGRGLREFRRAAADFQVTLEQEADAEEERARRAALPKPKPPSPESKPPAEQEPTGIADNPEPDDTPPSSAAVRDSSETP